MGICEVLTVVFIVLKLMGIIAWSWWAVTALLWVTPVLVILYFLLVFKFGVLSRR